MWSFVADTPSAVQLVMLITCVLMGVSHIVQPRMWTAFFAGLVARGEAGLATNSFINSVPGAAIVALHQVWSGPAIVLTLFGWLLLTKTAIGLWAPQLGMRSLKMSRHGDRAFQFAGIALLLIAAAAGLALAG